MIQWSIGIGRDGTRDQKQMLREPIGNPRLGHRSGLQGLTTEDKRTQSTIEQIVMTGGPVIHLVVESFGAGVLGGRSDDGGAGRHE